MTAMDGKDLKEQDPTTRFSDRVDAYIKYRPGYPDGLIASLHDLIGLEKGSVVADIGSGTGISSEIFLRHGMTVYGVEPNAAMRRGAEEYLAGFEDFHSINAQAEETALPDQSVDLIAAGQAFHWFDREAAKEEWRRILKPQGHVILFWNSRRTHGTPFLEAYEEMLLQFGTDYRQVNHQNISDEEIVRFFHPNVVQTLRLYNEQLLDPDGLRGRLESSSYIPRPGHPDYMPMVGRLSEIFAEFQQENTVRIEYDLVAYISNFNPKPKSDP